MGRGSRLHTEVNEYAQRRRATWFIRASNTGQVELIGQEHPRILLGKAAYKGSCTHSTRQNRQSRRTRDLGGFLCSDFLRFEPGNCLLLADSCLLPPSLVSVTFLLGQSELPLKRRVGAEVMIGQRLNILRR